MSIITLTTDLGLKDYYVAGIKGHILSQLPNATIVDISHEIPPFNISVAAFCLKNCFMDFPLGSIHILGVSPEANEHVRHLVIKHKGHYFIGADNGMFSLLFDESPDEVYNINIVPDENHRTFPTKDVFVQVACHIGRGGTLELIGSKVDDITKRTNFQPVIEENVIRGMAMYIDAYGNVTKNITRSLINFAGKGRKFSIVFRRSDYNINELKQNYSEVPEGEKLALFSTNDHLEIAINKGNASKLFGIKLSDIIRIEFKDASGSDQSSGMF